MNFRTDLALESRENLGNTDIKGVSCETQESDGIKITRIEVLNKEGENALGRARGKYITAEIPSLAKVSDLCSGVAHTLANELSQLIPDKGTVLVAGLGNNDITPDALGPLCSDGIFATRHISEELARSTGLGKLRPVADITPGVLGKTGIETVEIISGIVGVVKPCALITVDSLAARNVSRLGRTIQITDTGITPGSGVGNSRAEINKKSVGVPVIAIGVPTVVDAATLAYDILSDDENRDIKEKLPEEAYSMMVTPREIDLLVDRAAKMISLAINLCLQPSISAEDLLMLVG